jgi:zinc D-Ala-D-Ala dipeptidase
MLRRMSALVATRCRTGTHISGSAIDISVIDQNTGGEIDRGGSYLEISERTPMESPFVTKEEHVHRNEIAAIFRRHCWFAYPYEFWHFSCGDPYAEYLSGSGKPARYGPIVFENGATHPIGGAESDALLEPLEFYQHQIAAALARIKR